MTNATSTATNKNDIKYEYDTNPRVYQADLSDNSKAIEPKFMYYKIAGWNKKSLPSVTVSIDYKLIEQEESNYAWNKDFQQ